MKKILLICLLVSAAAALYAGGMRVGMTGVVKEKVKELDVKVTEYTNKNAKDTSPGNNAPVISSLSASRSGATATVTCTASDADGDTLVYAWSASTGVISGSGPSVTWAAPAYYGSYSVTCSVSDGNAGSDEDSAGISMTGSLTNDFIPCLGEPASSTSGSIETRRLLTATSSDGITFTRDSIILADRGSVADAVVLPSGRIIVYFVIGTWIVNGSEANNNGIVAAISDDNGSSWSYKDVTMHADTLVTGTKPVDPNVVLMPDASIRMFATIDPDQGGAALPRTYSFVSTSGNGGFTYDIERTTPVFNITDAAYTQGLLDPENYRFAADDWKLWCGGKSGGNRLAKSTDTAEVDFTDKGDWNCGILEYGSDTANYIVSDIAVSSTTGMYRMYTFGKNGSGEADKDIRSLVSVDDGTTWAVESGSRLSKDLSTGKEAQGPTGSTVVKMSNGKYLMVYETEIP